MKKRLPLWPLLGAAAILILAAAVAGTPAGRSAVPLAQTAVTADSAYFGGWGRVLFDHDLHVDALELSCAECHHETNAAKLQMPHEEYFRDFWIDCSICHSSDEGVVMEPTSCSECHHSDPLGIADETLSAKVVIHQSCWECHDSGTGADASEGCSFCHDAFEPPE